jgi:hypothetical protein
MVWAGSKQGDFSVRSAYHFAKSLLESSKGSSSSTGTTTQIWKDIWWVQGPRVLNSFLWKACANVLPTKENLYRRGVIEDATCPICRLEPETVCHVLWNCPAASDVWLECPSRIQKNVVVEDSFLNIFQQLYDKFEAEDLQFIAITARLIWLWRNDVVFGGDFLSTSIIIRNAKEQQEASNSADQARRDKLFKTVILAEVAWKPPAMGSVKANWDAAVDRERGKIGVGVVVRDHGGKVVAAFCCVLSAALDPANI